ncbi:MAG: GTPase Der [Firmicutes bacterium ADurb.Bin506]|nr:MAG: GTPase Der [Firmicutes bacterium ADurb.Bin506]
MGKSSLVNRVLGEERSIVSNVPGTTRDSIDASFVRDGQQYIIIDTAGIRRRGRIEPGVEKYSVVRAYRSVDRCDVALTVLDGTEDPAAQDVRIAGYAHEAGKASVVVVNKWDIVERDESTARDYESKLRLQIDFMPYAPVVFASALTGRRIGRVLDMVRECALEHRRRVPTADVNRVLQDALMRNPVPTVKGKEVKIFYASQVSTRPPHFVVWANYPELVHFSYQRYLENTMRNAFGFTGTPIQVTVKRRGQ